MAKAIRTKKMEKPRMYKTEEAFMHSHRKFIETLPGVVRCSFTTGELIIFISFLHPFVKGYIDGFSDCHPDIKVKIVRDAKRKPGG